MIFKKSQTATEYLIILGVVITIAVITVGTVSDVISIGGGLDEQTIRLELASQPIAITEYSVSDYETVITLKNNFGELIRIDGIAINNEKCLFFYGVEHRLNPGISKNIRCMNVYTLTEDEVAYEIEINYTDLKKGGSYTQYDAELVLVGKVANNYYSLVSSNRYWNSSINGCYDNTTSPIPLCTCNDLNKTRNDLTSDFLLQNSIDFDRCKREFGVDFTQSNGQGGWSPICINSESCEYAATFDGGLNIINNLYINVSGEHKVGFFGDASNSNTLIKNLGLINVNVTGYLTSTAGLVAYGWYTELENIFVTGEVIGYNDYVGGAIGDGLRSIASKSYSHTKVTGLSGADEIGGLIGRGYRGVISNTYATGDVSGDQQVGGLYGHGDRGEVSDSFATGNVAGSYMVGGLIGRMGIATVTNVYATGNVSGGTYVGGLLGYSYAATIRDSHALGFVISGSTDVGGLTGYNDLGEIYNSFAYAPLSVAGTRIGGLVGGTDYADPNEVNGSYWINSSNGGAASNCVTGTSAFDYDCYEVASINDVPLYT